jgi:hypothetical protein
MTSLSLHYKTKMGKLLVRREKSKQKCSKNFDTTNIQCGIIFDTNKALQHILNFEIE